MGKVSDEARLHFTEAVQPYKEKIDNVLSKEKNTLSTISSSSGDSEYKKLSLCEDMIYVATLYIAQNSLSVKILDVKNQDNLNDARKMIYKAIIYLEEIVTNKIDVAYSDLSENLEKISNIRIDKRYKIVRKLGLAINLLKDALGDNSKWHYTFVEIEGRFTVVAKNLIDMKLAARDYFDPQCSDYETTVLYIRLLQRMLSTSATAYRDKYELSTHRIDDMRDGINFLLALHRLDNLLGQKNEAEEVKKKAIVWKNRLDADQKKGISK